MRKLREEAKTTLFVLLAAYRAAQTGFSDRNAPTPQQSTLDNAHGIARDAEALAEKLDLLFEEDSIWGRMRFMTPYLALAATLRLLARNLGRFSRMVAKPSRFDAEVIKGRILVASEFVYLNTGSYNDEHLADLLQQLHFLQLSKSASAGRQPGRVEGSPDPERPPVDDFSGDAIRKHRERFKRDYPEAYRVIAKQAVRAYLHPAPKD